MKRSIVFACISAVLVLLVAASLFTHWQSDRQQTKLIFPICSTFNASVGTSNGAIVWLDADSGSAVHDVVALADIVNAGYAARTRGANEGRKFNDAALANIIDEHNQIEVLDLRGTAVTGKRLVELERLPNLRWLIVDAKQCEGAVSTLATLPLKKLIVSGEVSTEDRAVLERSPAKLTILAAEPE